MKTVKSLLLGSAAGIVAVAGAQAADLPVKAKPAEYVKICSIYGAGFYYVPGTDICLKVGGYVRADIAFAGTANGNPYNAGGGGRNTAEETAAYNTRYRGIVSFDARSQTEFGTLRAYVRAGWEMNSANTFGSGTYGGAIVDTQYRGPTYFDRAFIQFAGFTVGKTQSFFDFYSNALNYNTSLTGGSQTGVGINLLAYTAQFAGGFSATISLEDTVHRRQGMWDASTNGLGVGNLAGLGAGLGGFTGVGGLLAGIPAFVGTGANAQATAGGATGIYGNYRAQQLPDIVGNVRVDQPWGSAQIMGALRDVSGSCYGATCNQIGLATDPAGGPGSRIGYAVGGGVQFNLPWAKGDQLWLQATYGRGASGYLGLDNFVATSVIARYNNGGAGTLGGGPLGGVGVRQGGFTGMWAFDGLFQTGGRVALTEGFQANAAIQHFWTPSVRTSVFGGVVAINYDAQARQLFCTGVAGNIVVAGSNPGAGRNAAFGAGCNPDFAIYQVGSRTIWSPVKDLDIGVEVLYTRYDQRFVGDHLIAQQGSRPAGLYRASDNDTVTGLLRFQRNFVP